jgi:hypothetical protein
MKIKRVIRQVLKDIDEFLGIRDWFSDDIRPPKGFDLHGEKELDWGWVAANVPPGPCRALDIGCVGSPISLILASMGYEVVGIDLRAGMPFMLESFQFVQGDFNQIPLEPASFDLVVCCSTVEHIGLAGRYGSREDPEGDIKAMSKVLTVLKPMGTCILTVPVGLDGVYRPWHRVYGKERLPRLLHGFSIVKCRYFVKRPRSYWYEASEREALSFPSSASCYALGQFVLKPRIS